MCLKQRLLLLEKNQTIARTAARIAARTAALCLVEELPVVDPVMDKTVQVQLDSCRMSPSDVIWSAHSITSSDTARALLFESGDLLLALPADSVREVIDMPATHPVPGSAAWFGGVAVYRGRPVPVIDAAAYLDPEVVNKKTVNKETANKKTESKKASTNQVYNRAIVVHLASSTYLIAAEKILNLCSLTAEDDYPVLQHLPDHLKHRAVKKVCEYENRVVAVIDLPELLRCTKLLRECALC